MSPQDAIARAMVNNAAPRATRSDAETRPPITDSEHVLIADGGDRQVHALQARALLLDLALEYRLDVIEERGQILRIIVLLEILQERARRVVPAHRGEALLAVGKAHFEQQGLQIVGLV